LKSTRPDFAALTAPETSFVTDPSYKAISVTNSRMLSMILQ
jgi:hypothetical protein